MSGQSSRQMVVDEMFPDGPGNLDYVDAEDGVSLSKQLAGEDLGHSEQYESSFFSVQI